MAEAVSVAALFSMLVVVIYKMIDATITVGAMVVLF